MSSNLPPSGPPTPEVLEGGGGTPLGAEAGRGSGGGLRRGLFIGGGVVGLTAIGVGAWAAWSFLGTGPQPAEALPADTLGYISVDLDPSGGQKIEALRTLNKFPAFEDEVGIDTDDDIRKALVEKVLEEAPCDGLDYEDDFETWLGDRAAVAAVDIGEDEPAMVIVVQVTDAAAADDGLNAIKDCGAGDADSGGWAIDGDWAVISESQETAEQVADDAQDGSLADDEEFQRWTGEAGDSGVVSMYAGPAAGDYVADHAGDLIGSTECLASPDEFLGQTLEGDGTDGCGDTSDGSETGSDEGGLPDELDKKLRDFEGVAVTVRFDDGAIEIESAGDASLAGTGLLGSGSGGDAISTLPDDTGAAFGVGFDEGWFADLLEFAAPYAGTSDDIDELLAQIEDETGLDVPGDIETMFGESAVLAVSSDIDPESFFASPDGSDVPVALKVKGDPDEIEAVLEKLRAQLPPDQTAILDSDSDGDMIVIGPSEDYREDVLGDGELGDNEVFQDVVREVDEADVVFYVNVNEFEDAIEELAEGDDDFVDNLKPLSGFGASAWVDDDVAHGVLRITTD